jgi:hypothetical protein
MKPPNVLEYQRRLPRPRRQGPSLRFIGAILLSLFDLFLGFIMGEIAHAVLTEDANHHDPMAVLFGAPLFLCMFIVSAVTIAMAFRPDAEPWRRIQLAAVFVPQGVSVLMPVIVLIRYWHS